MTSGYMVFTCGGALPFGSTRYLTLPYIGTAMATTERTLPYAANTAKKLWAYITANTLDDETAFTLRINGVDTGLVLTVLAGQTGVKSATADVSVADGDVLSIKVATPFSGEGSMTIIAVGVSFLLP